MLNKKRPKRTPPGSQADDIDYRAVDAAFETEQADDQAFFFRCCKLFGGKNISIEPDPIFTRSMGILWRLYYEFQRISYTAQDAGDAAIKTFLRYY